MNQAELYANINGKVLRRRMAHFEEFLPSLSWSRRGGGGRTTALDVGCGPGDFTSEQLLPRLQREGVSQVVGVDLEESMVHHANDFHAKEGSLRFLQLDITDPNIEETTLWKEVGPVHKIFSYYCLNWVQNQKQAVENLFKLLSDDNGEMVLFVVAHNGLAKTYRKLAATSRWGYYLQDVADYIWPHQDSQDPAGEFKALLEDKGFTVDTCRLDDHYHSLDSEYEGREIVASINPFLTRLPKEDQEEFLQECVKDCYRTKYLVVECGDKPKHYIYNRVIVVKARKCKSS